MWIDGLCESFPGCRIFQSSAKSSVYVLHINRLEYPKISPPTHFRKENDLRLPIQQPDGVLTHFSNARNSLYATRYDVVQEQSSIAIRPSGKAQKTGQQHPEDTHDFDSGHTSRCDYNEFSDHGSWCDDRSRGNHSDHDYSDDEYSDHGSWSDEISEYGHSERDRSDDGLSERDYTEDNRSESDSFENHQVRFSPSFGLQIFLLKFLSCVEPTGYRWTV